VETFERARLDEVKDIVQHATGEDALDSLEAALVELQSSHWLRPPPRALILAVQEKVMPLRRRQAHSRFVELSDRLRDAHAAMDEATCRHILGEWDVLAEQVGGIGDGDLQEQAEGVSNWLRELDKVREADKAYEEACAALRNALAHGAQPQQLDSLEGNVRRLGMGIPDSLRDLLESRKRRIRTAARTRRIVKVGAVAGAVLLVAACVFVVVRWQRARTERQGAYTQFQTAVESENLATAGTRLDSIRRGHPEYLERREFADLVVEYEKQLSAENRRVTRLRQLTTELERELDDFSQSDRRESLRIEALLAEATALARTSEDTLLIEGSQKAFQAAQARKTAERVSAFNRELAVLSEQCQKVTEAETAALEAAAGSVPAPEKLQALGTVTAMARKCVALANTLANRPDAPADGAGRARGLGQQASDVVRRTEGKTKEIGDAEQRFQRLVSCSANPERLAEALRSFAHQYPLHQLASEFRSAAGMLPAWQAAVAWRAIAGQWTGRTRVRSLTESKVDERLRKVAEHVRLHTASPVRSAAAQYQKYLQVAERAMQDGAMRDLDVIKGVLTAPLFSDAVTIRTRDGRILYSLKEKITTQRFNGSPLYTVDYFVDSALMSERRTLKASDISSGPEPAPHIRLVKDIIAQADAFTGDKWETFYLHLAETVRRDRTMDAVLRGSIVARLLLNASRTSPFESDRIREMLQRLSAIDMDVAWMNPNDKTAQAARVEIEREINALTTLTALIARIERQCEGMAEALTPYEPVGLLLGERGKVVFRTKVDQAALFVVVADEAGASRFQEFGSVHDGVLVVRPDASGKYDRGTPVFIRAK